MQDGAEAEGGNVSSKKHLKQIQFIFKGFEKRDIVRRAILPMPP